MIPPFHWWRTVFYLIPTIACYTIGLGTLSLASTLVDPSGRFAHGCARLWAWLILATTGVEVNAHGLERLQPARGYVFVSNHQSIYDIPIIFWWLPFQLRIIAKDSLGAFPFLGWHLRRSGHLLVNRRSPGATVVRRLKELIRRGQSVIVFPEGTRSVDGALLPFKRGVFLMAIEAGIPVVPVSVAGSRHVMKKGRLMTRPGLVELIVHEPIDTAGLAPDAARRLAERVRAVVSEPVEQERARNGVATDAAPARA